MAEEFDPYFKWLAIPRHEQPPDHYRLLGIPLFVDDADVIDYAAAQRMLLLRNMQISQHAALAQKILVEVGRAKACLLNPPRKAEYDVELRQQIAAQTERPAAHPRLVKQPPPVAPPVPSASVDAAETVTPEESFTDRALAAGRSFSSKARSAAQRAALVAEKTKLETLDLPRAYLELGRALAQDDRFREQFSNLYYDIEHLEAEQQQTGQLKPASLVDRAKLAARRIKDSIHAPSSEINVAYRRLGKAVFAAHGRAAGPHHLTQSIVDQLDRIAELEAEAGSS